MLGDEFVASVRYALRHLYDSRALQRSPLVRQLGLATSSTPGFELRQAISKAIRSMRPGPGISEQAEVWRVYQVLLYRYIQRLSQLEVADQLGISVRQLRREERRACCALADQLAQKLVADASPPAAPVVDLESSVESNDLAWVEYAVPTEPTNLNQMLSAVSELMHPLAKQQGTRVNVALSENPILLAIHPIVLRQILLSLLGAVIRQAEGQVVFAGAKDVDGWAKVCVCVRGCASNCTALDDDPGLTMARRLVERCGGRVLVSPQQEDLGASIELPVVERLPVLLIDDNPGFQRLLQRYTASTRYSIHPAANFQEGIALALEIRPRIIVLDVMMPDMDGWEVLGRLHEHPAAQSVPIIVCTILAEEGLARSLGAAAFVRKPVTQQAFLQALDDQVCPAEPGQR